MCLAIYVFGLKRGVIFCLDRNGGNGGVFGVKMGMGEMAKARWPKGGRGVGNVEEFCARGGEMLRTLRAAQNSCAQGEFT